MPLSTIKVTTDRDMTLLQTNDTELCAKVWKHVKELVQLDVYEEAEMNDEVVYSPSYLALCANEMSDMYT